MGATATITDVNVSRQFMMYDVWVMLGATLLLLLLMLSQSKLSRGEGILFLLWYVGYLISQIFIANGVWVF